MKGLFIPEITAEMFRNGSLESIEALMAEGEIYDIDYQQSSKDCISREAVVDKIHALQDELVSNDDSKWNRNKLAFKYMAYVNGIILAEPSVTPQRPQGRWNATENEEMNIVGYYCSCCDLPMETEEKTKYCPNCGADMSGDVESEEQE